MSADIWDSHERDHRDVVKIVRDCLAGERRIKQAGERYLPRSEGMSAKEYGAMKARASYLNAPRSLRDTLMGKVFRKPAMFDLGGLQKRLPWRRGGYHSWDALSREVLSEVLSVGRIALLVDPSERPTETQIMVFYDEDIVRWSKDNTGQLVEVVLKREDDKLLTLSIESGVYTFQIADGNPEVASTTGSRPLDFIPIVFITPSGLTPEAEYPPLADLALKSLSLSNGVQF